MADFDLGKSTRAAFLPPVAKETKDLLDDSTGSLLPGGEAVLFSPNQKFYVVYEQPDGQGGETLKLCSRRGTMFWEGYNDILSAHRTVMGNFENLHWDNHNHVVADVHIAGKPPVVVTLTQRNDGKWDWVPDVLK